MTLVFEPAFVQAPEHRPEPVVSEAGGIPVIDLAPLHLLDARLELQALVAQVEAACRDWGFFQVINHGVPQGVVERAWAASRGFFALPLEERRRVRRDEANPVGYYEAENTKNVRDWKEVFDLIVHEPTIIPSLTADGGDADGLIELRNQWPQSPLGCRGALTEYAQATEALAFKLLELIALTLNLPAKRLNDFFRDQTSFIRLNHYPPCPFPDLALGVGRHKDSGALTILAQDDVGGLDVRRQSDGEWVRVKPVPNSFIVNVGDLVQVWSNDRYESAEHRVSVNSAKERFSMPFFFNPAHHVMVKPLEELLDENNVGKYEEFNWGDFFMTRKKSNFKKLDVENIQIYHFKKNK
ncbi:feruloyl CoA ortho-hydroxylase 2-like [Zingiber officinale]|uniref:Fe2OG dioxygenase domain-containing protein n=1 Tax=Zingiber officinale TaxID=94328 RepID=A0A8J5LGK6_ZINOF|nr:feruloyl CoA ortho-hydroxylase 2-like [Zingiber officinale]KAG6526243.1 hypothetical protein ZIOFF_016225 [Zingiber officinale]